MKSHSTIIHTLLITIILSFLLLNKSHGVQVQGTTSYCDDACRTRIALSDMQQRMLWEDLLSRVNNLNDQMREMNDIMQEQLIKLEEMQLKYDEIQYNSCVAKANVQKAFCLASHKAQIEDGKQLCITAGMLGGKSSRKVYST